MALTSISPIDGRYHKKTQPLALFVSEYGLIYYRLMVEIHYLEALCDDPAVTECPVLTDEARKYLHQILQTFNEEEAQKVKQIEHTTNHDLKAAEYYLKERLRQHPDLASHSEFIHFGLTSEDINNLAYALMVKNSIEQVLLPALWDVLDGLTEKAKLHSNHAMLARTHGQAASPTTVGKELSNTIYRLRRVVEKLRNQDYLGKCNGAVGNFNALAYAYPDIDWPAFSKQFIEKKLQLTANPYTTQIEPHDWLAELCHQLARTNTILIDFSRDMWGYISLGYFTQRTVASEVGSSTMPHKVNPIDFENAEGNLGLANALYQFFADKLPISRYQRDLTDSTVLRNVGVAFGHSLLAYQALLKGLNKITVNQALLTQELSDQWALLAEPIQTVMRRYGLYEPYEQLKALTRGKKIDQATLHAFIDQSALPEHEKTRLKTLRPETYTGLAQQLTKQL